MSRATLLERLVSAAQQFVVLADNNVLDDLATDYLLDVFRCVLQDYECMPEAEQGSGE